MNWFGSHGTRTCFLCTVDIPVDIDTFPVGNVTSGPFTFTGFTDDVNGELQNGVRIHLFTEIPGGDLAQAWYLGALGPRLAEQVFVKVHADTNFAGNPIRNPVQPRFSYYLITFAAGMTPLNNTIYSNQPPVVDMDHGNVNKLAFHHLQNVPLTVNNAVQMVESHRAEVAWDIAVDSQPVRRVSPTHILDSIDL